MFPTGPGKWKKAESRHQTNAFIIYNFDIGGDQPKKEHKAFMRDKIANQLRAGLDIHLVGRADRRGKVGENQELSEKRAASTLAYLRSEVSTGFYARIGGMHTGGDMGSWKAPYTEDDRCVYLILVPPEPHTHKSD